MGHRSRQISPCPLKQPGPSVWHWTAQAPTDLDGPVPAQGGWEAVILTLQKSAEVVALDCPSLQVLRLVTDQHTQAPAFPV